MIIVVVILYCLLAVIDAYITIDKISRYGIGIELNPLTRWTAKTFGHQTGVISSILIPTVGVLMLGYHFPPLLYIIFGARLTLCAFQLKVLFDARARKTSCGTF